MDAEELWEISKPFAEGYRTLARGRGFVLGYGAGGPLAIPYTEISKYWFDRATDVNDVKELDLFVRLVQKQDSFYLDHQNKKNKKK